MAPSIFERIWIPADLLGNPKESLNHGVVVPGALHQEHCWRLPAPPSEQRLIERISGMTNQAPQQIEQPLSLEQLVPLTRPSRSIQQEANASQRLFSC